MKLENYTTEYERAQCIYNTTVIILYNTKNISEEHYENFAKCPNVFLLLYLITLQELKPQRLGVPMR